MPSGAKSKVGAIVSKRTIVALKVKFELNAKDGLRRIVFGLEKDTEGDVVIWKIHFDLHEREKKSEAYGDPLVSLDVEIDAKLNPKAEVAAQAGLTPGQAAHALGPAADDARATTTGEVDAEDAKETVQATLKKK
jgi:hypothetical protein